MTALLGNATFNRKRVSLFMTDSAPHKKITATADVGSKQKTYEKPTLRHEQVLRPSLFRAQSWQPMLENIAVSPEKLPDD
jgi:hypothetical protein